MLYLYKEVNLGVKRFLVSFYVVVTVFQVYFIVNRYINWKQEEAFDIELITTAEAETGNVGYLPQHLEMHKSQYTRDMKLLVYFFLFFQIGYWGGIFFILWVREGWLTKKTT